MYDVLVIANRYELASAIGSGGFATVYRALDRVDNREVAVKIMPAVPFGAEDVIERFRLEALALSRLRSTNVARVYDFGRDDEKGLYLVMELIDGVPLEPAKLGRVLLAHEVLRAARALLSGLAEAHAARIVHRDIKPANVIVPNGIAGLGELKLLDFGIAQSEHMAQLEAEFPTKSNEPKRALGTPAYMAPELLMGEGSSPASDVYAVGLVLFELLGHTLLFPERPAREQLKLRTEADPALALRAPTPLDGLLAKMLARDPSRRFADAGEALSVLVNMETAPVDILTDVVPTPIPASPPSRRRLMPPPAYSRPTLGTMRLSRLDEDAVVALRSTLDSLDLPMLEALARRERGSEVGRVARALSLGLRLEIDAAAIVLEPLAERTDLARAVAACVLAPRARAATRARIERGMAGSDDWVDAVDVRTGELLVAIDAAICGPEEISRVLARSERLLARDSSRTEARLTVELVKIALGARATGDTAGGLRAYDELVATDARTTSPLLSIARALLVAPLAFRIDDHTSRASFERASQLASDAGATLLEARALVSWGGMLIEVPGRLHQGLRVLERVTTLLLHADVPSLEHLAAHNRGAAYIVEGQWALACRQFQRAREVASGEAPIEFELVSGAQEVLSRLASGDFEGGRAVARLLDITRNLPVAPREALLVKIACSLAKLSEGDLAGARSVLSYAKESTGAAGDGLLLAGALDVIYAAGAGEPVDHLASAAELHRTAEEHGFAAFYWIETIRAIVSHLEDPDLRAKTSHAVERLIVLLAPAKKE